MQATKKNPTVVGVFRERTQAQSAIQELLGAGFRENQIGVTTREGKIQAVEVVENEDTSYAAEGAAAGVMTGAGVGALWGLAVITGLLPAVGPAIAGGTLAAILSSAVAGAAASGLVGALIGMGMSREEAEFYETEFKAGRTIITVDAGPRAAEALAIFRRFHGYEYATANDARDAS